MKTLIEIQAAEGGMDSKLLVKEMFSIYSKACINQNFKVHSVQWTEGCVNFSVEGVGALEFFEHEIGNHRWIRIPPTEKKGRVHTSTVCVSVLNEAIKPIIEFKDSDIERWTTKGSGKGGQKRNKVETSVVLKHIPTGIVVKCEQERTQSQNEKLAWLLLTERVQKKIDTEFFLSQRNTKRQQVGTTNNGDKKRTYRVRDEMVIDHSSNRTISLSKIYKGMIELLH